MTAVEHRHHDPMQGELRWLTLPRPDNPTELPYRRYWTGFDWQLGTASYWESLAALTPAYDTHRLGETLAEEVGACLLGGYGMPFWLAHAAFERLRDSRCFDPETPTTAADLETLLSAPLQIRGTTRRYRFPRQRAARLSAAISAIADIGLADLPHTDQDLRDWLQTIPGIGPKTASWVVRNHLDSDKVAIIDIHLVRAGIVAGIFDPQWRLPRDYDLYETAFLGWAEHANVRASHLDACIWGVLAHDTTATRDILGLDQVNQTPQPVWST